MQPRIADRLQPRVSVDVESRSCQSQSMIRSRAGESLFRSQGVQENYICAVVIEAAITPNPTKGLRSTYLLVRTCKSGSKSHGHAKARDQLLGPGGAFTRSDLGAM